MRRGMRFLMMPIAEPYNSKGEQAFFSFPGANVRDGMEYNECRTTNKKQLFKLRRRASMKPFPSWSLGTRKKWYGVGSAWAMYAEKFQKTSTHRLVHTHDETASRTYVCFGDKIP